MIDRIEAEVGSLVLYRGAFINLQFPVRGGGERNTNGFADAKNAAWIPLGSPRPSRLFRSVTIKGEPTFSIAPMPARWKRGKDYRSLQGRLPFLGTLLSLNMNSISAYV